jgi:hypothetical protein
VNYVVTFIPLQQLKLKWIGYLFQSYLQSNMGAKNHAIVMPDANVDATLNAIVAAGFGAAGQRCMALSTVVFVGGLKSW